VLAWSLLAEPFAFAAWDLTKPGDPNRSWGVSLSSGVQYNDNFFGSQNDPQRGFQEISDIRFRAAVPIERLFLGVQYDYGIIYPQDVRLGNVEQTHNLSASATYIVTPRLEFGLSETYISSLQPGLVTGPTGVPISISNAGGYIYDAVGGHATYALTPRWTAAAGGSWDIWRYASTINAFINDHEDLSGTLSALYGLDTRTTVGLNFQYSEDTYVHPGLNDSLNGNMDVVYLSLSRRFNPRLSLTLNGGYSIRSSSDGSTSSSPSGLGSVNYNYGPNSTISLTIAESLSQASVGITRSFSAQENTSLALQASHRLTVRLQALADLTYTYSAFTAPVAGSTVSRAANEQSTTAHVGLSYSFRDWLSGTVNCYHNQLLSSNPGVVTPYSSNQISLGMTVSY
jgi:hypothetical protein